MEFDFLGAVSSLMMVLEDNPQVTVLSLYGNNANKNAASYNKPTQHFGNLQISLNKLFVIFSSRVYLQMNSFSQINTHATEKMSLQFPASRKHGTSSETPHFSVVSKLATST